MPRIGVYVDFSTYRWRYGDYGGEISGRVYDDRARTVTGDLGAYNRVELELSKPGFILFSVPVDVHQTESHRWSFVVPRDLFVEEGVFRVAIVGYGDNIRESSEFAEFTVVV